MFLPLFLSFCLLICLFALGALGYQSVTASNFFGVKSIDVRGVERASKNDISRIVESSTEQARACGTLICRDQSQGRKGAICKDRGSLDSAARRDPRERCRAGSDWRSFDFQTAIFLSTAREYLWPAANAKEEKIPVTLIGWDESKTEKAMKDNLERVKMYQKMIAEWRDFDLVSRDRESSILPTFGTRRPSPKTQASRLTIAVGKDDIRRALENGIEAIVGKGANVRRGRSCRANMILSSLRPGGIASSGQVKTANKQ